MAHLNHQSTNWRPERKIIAVAVVTVGLWVASFFDFEVPAEVAASAITLVGYFIPNAK